MLCMPSCNALQNCQYRSERVICSRWCGCPNLPKIRLQNRTQLNGFSVKLEQDLITHRSASNMLQNPSCCGQKSLLYRFTVRVTKQITPERIHQTCKVRKQSQKEQQAQFYLHRNVQKRMPQNFMRHQFSRRN
jgi:hypothetical protein